MTSDGLVMRSGINIPRATALVCCAAAAALLAGGSLTGHAVMALALAVGVLIGAGNGYLAQRFVEAGVSFTLTSLARLTVLTAAALVVGMALGFGRVYLVVGGLAVSQLVLVAVAFSARHQR